jgi:cell wall hydrolase
MTPAEAYELTMVALALWREARGEPYEVRKAVASVILNRRRISAKTPSKPDWWGEDLVGIVTAPFQFTSISVRNDPQLNKWPKPADKQWQECQDIAVAVVTDTLADTTMGATHYFDISIPAPAWADAGKFTVQLGRLRFYKLA